MDVGLGRLPLLTSLVTRLRGARVGLLAHPAQRQSQPRARRRRAAPRRGEAGNLLGPGRGYGGEAQDIDRRRLRRGTAAPARPWSSLYGDRFEDLSPRPGATSPGLDVLLVDLAGRRLALLHLRLDRPPRPACSAARQGPGRPPLDRPNPHRRGIASQAEGLTTARRLAVLRGPRAVPIRHSLTAGESWPGSPRRWLLPRARGRPRRRAGPGLGIARPPPSAWDRPFVLPSPPTCPPRTRPWSTREAASSRAPTSPRAVARPAPSNRRRSLDRRASLAEGLAATGLGGFRPACPFCPRSRSTPAFSAAVFKSTSPTRPPSPGGDLRRPDGAGPRPGPGAVPLPDRALRVRRPHPCLRPPDGLGRGAGGHRGPARTRGRLAGGPVRWTRAGPRRWTRPGGRPSGLPSGKARRQLGCGVRGCTSAGRQRRWRRAKPSAVRGWRTRLADGGRGSRMADAARRWRLAARGWRARLAVGERGSRMDIGGSRMADAARGWTLAARGWRTRLADGHCGLADGGRGSRSTLARG